MERRADSDEDACPAHVSVVSGPVVLSCDIELCVEKWYQSERWRGE